MEKENQEYLKKNKDIAEKMLWDDNVMAELITFAKNLCNPCKVKMLKNPRMALDEYCEVCRERANMRMKKVEEMMK